IPEIFRRELGELMTVVARDATVNLWLPAGMEADLLGGIPHETTGEGLRVRLGDMFSGQERELYLKVRLRPGERGERIELRAEQAAHYAPVAPAAAAPMQSLSQELAGGLSEPTRKSIHDVSYRRRHSRK